MAEKRIGKIREKLSKAPSLIFIEFSFILLVVFSLILFTSVSFYRNIIENIIAIDLQNTITDIQELDKDTDAVDRKIHKIAKEHSVIVEIYQRADRNDSLFSKPVFVQYSKEVFSLNGTETEKTVPTIEFDYGVFQKSEGHRYSDTSMSGYFKNASNGNEYFIMATQSEDGNNLFLSAVSKSVIDSQAKAISIAVSFILITTFLAISLIAYLFITRITKPLRDIRDVTKAMAETNDVSLRIPRRKSSLNNETDETISSVNYLYESLIITQENLKEKTEFLANQLQERDIEQKSREEFIAGTSHELKTPIAIIQGYAEGAKYLAGDPDALNEYCDTIIDECVRMTNLVLNMMSLSNLQQTKLLNFREFSIKEFISDRMKLLEKTFEKKGIRTENLITDNIIGKGDPDKLHFVINNLFSNAISYIGDEDKVIRVRYEDMDMVYRIFVFNSGKHIPQGELERLWESFYRNDPARNRNDGHFGLGLSIVKSVQDAHSQACGVDNTDGGVEFWFDILK